jgi:hypothetical protein
MLRGLAWCCAGALALPRPAAAAPGMGDEPPQAPDATPDELTQKPGVAPEPGTTPEEPPPEPGAAPDEQLSPGTGGDIPPERARPAGRLHNYLGLAAGVDLTARRYGEPAGSLGELAATTATGGVMARLAGYADRRPAGSRAVRMTLPELMLILELGGTAARRDATATQQGLGPARHGVAAGASGLANIGAAIASPGRIGVYGKLNVGQRFVARSNNDLEGAHFIGSLGPGVGLRAAVARRFTLLLGGAFDGVLGVQRIDQKSRLIAQLAPAVELAIHTQPRPDVYFAVVARGDRTVVGQRYGGTRLHGRAAVEVVWQLANRGRVRFAGLLLTYEGSRVDAAPGHPQFGAVGEQRSGHALVLAGGVTI